MRSGAVSGVTQPKKEGFPEAGEALFFCVYEQIVKFAILPFLGEKSLA